jgi:hypothetical protein
MNGRADRRPDPTPINKFGIVAPVGRNDVEEHANSPVYRPANDISHPARRVLDIPRRASFPSFFPGASPSFVLRQWSHRATSAQTKPASRMQEAVAATRSTDRVAALLMFDVREIT